MPDEEGRFETRAPVKKSPLLARWLTFYSPDTNITKKADADFIDKISCNNLPFKLRAEVPLHQWLACNYNCIHA